jgi:hypothetical protein
MAYEDITLTTSDNVKIKAYMIPARKNVLSKSEMMSMSATQREEAGEKAMAEWNQEKVNDDALEVSRSFLIVTLRGLRIVRKRSTDRGHFSC